MSCSSLQVMTPMPFGSDYETMALPHLAYTRSATHSVDIDVSIAPKKHKPSEKVMEAIKATVGSGMDEAFFIADLGALQRQARKWYRLLPRVVSTL